MGKSIWVGTALVLAAIAGFLLYQNAEQRRGQERVLTEVRAQGDAARAQLERVAKEQEQIRRTLGEAQTTLAGSADKTSLLMREDLVLVAGMRTALAEAYMNFGRMPANAAEAGLSAPEQYRGKTLKSATLLADGTIELVFDAQSGVDGGRVRFVPDLTHVNATGIQWRCETDDYPLIARVAPTCEYKQAAIAADTAIKAPPANPR
jgi:hypothetical protein